MSTPGRKKQGRRTPLLTILWMLLVSYLALQVFEVRQDWSPIGVVDDVRNLQDHEVKTSVLAYLAGREVRLLNWTRIAKASPDYSWAQ
jgi:hypothetical protein